MRNINRLILIPLLLLFTITLSAQQFYDGSGSYIGRLDSYGRIYDSHGSYKVQVRSDGKIYSSNGTLLGWCTSDKVYDSHGSYLLFIHGNRIYDRNMSYIGMRGSNGNVYNYNGSLIGMANGIGIRLVAIIYFTGLF
jgi:hypothetical protein